MLSFRVVSSSPFTATGTSLETDKFQAARIPVLPLINNRIDTQQRPQGAATQYSVKLLRDRRNPVTTLSYPIAPWM